MSEERKPIVMGGKYRLRGFPTSRVILVCTDGPDPRKPVACWMTTDVNSTPPSWGLTSRTSCGESLEAPNFDLIEVGEWDDFVDGEPVMVRDTEQSIWRRFHFWMVGESGHPCTYPNGLSKWSFSKEANPTPWPWKFCRRPTPEEIAS